MPVFHCELPLDTSVDAPRIGEAVALAKAYAKVNAGFAEMLAAREIKPYSRYEGMVLCVAPSREAAAVLERKYPPFISVTLVPDPAFDSVPDGSDQGEYNVTTPASAFPDEWRPEDRIDNYLAFIDGGTPYNIYLESTAMLMGSGLAICPEQCLGDYQAKENRTAVAHINGGFCPRFSKVPAVKVLLLDVSSLPVGQWTNARNRAQDTFAENLRTLRSNMEGTYNGLVEPVTLTRGMGVATKKEKKNDIGTYEVQPKLTIAESIYGEASGFKPKNNANKAEDILQYYLLYAEVNRASDIHFQPSGQKFRVRMRIDGDMLDIDDFALQDGGRITGALMGYSQMKASDKVAQDAKLPIKFVMKAANSTRLVNLRLAANPVTTLSGEEFMRIVVRIPSADTADQKLEDLFPLKRQVEAYRRAVAAPNGIILITGETGSGKSTTLMSLIKEVNTEDVSIQSIESPVEIIIEGVAQMEAEDRDGRRMKDLLKSMLRSDPDFAYVGEIRNGEEGSLALELAATGHTVFTTVHTNNPFATLTRLVETMKLDAMLVRDNIRLISTQRLIKRPCPVCSKKEAPTPHEVEVFKNNGVELPNGIRLIKEQPGAQCSSCKGSGYKGRIVATEILEFSDGIKLGVLNRYAEEKLLELAIQEQGYRTMVQNALELAVMGYTTVKQALSVAKR